MLNPDRAAGPLRAQGRPAARPSGGSWRASRRASATRPCSVPRAPARRFTDRQCDRRRPGARRWCWPTTRPWRRSSATSCGSSSPTTPLSTSSATTTTTSRRPTCRAPTPTSRRTASINEEIDRLRHSATRSLFERRDVIVVASVSLHLRPRHPASTYTAACQLHAWASASTATRCCASWSTIQYARNDIEPSARHASACAATSLEICPAYEEPACRDRAVRRRDRGASATSTR
jgi:hypothetical protein